MIHLLAAIALIVVGLILIANVTDSDNWDGDLTRLEIGIGLFGTLLGLMGIVRLVWLAFA